MDATWRGSTGWPSRAIRRRGWASTRTVIGQDPAPPALANRNLWRRPGSTVNLVRGTLGPFGCRPRPFTKRMAGFVWPSVNVISPECCHWLTRITWLESSTSYNALWGSLMSACFTINAPNMPFETSSPENRARYTQRGGSIRIRIILEITAWSKNTCNRRCWKRVACSFSLAQHLCTMNRSLSP